MVYPTGIRPGVHQNLPQKSRAKSNEILAIPALLSIERAIVAIDAPALHGANRRRRREVDEGPGARN
jgi:hypothetical protein